MPTVTTISGGPTSGFVDGDSLQTALYHTPIALALDDLGGELFVADRDPLAVPVGRADLLDCKPRNVWRPVKFGKDERVLNLPAGQKLPEPNAKTVEGRYAGIVAAVRGFVKTDKEKKP